MSKYRNPDCIVPSIAGRLGNNMFMIAHAYAKALDQNKQLVVPRYQVGHMLSSMLDIGRVRTILRSIVKPSNNYSLLL
jgi:hypothetical protein